MSLYRIDFIHSFTKLLFFSCSENFSPLKLMNVIMEAINDDKGTRNHI